MRDHANTLNSCILTFSENCIIWTGMLSMVSTSNQKLKMVPKQSKYTFYKDVINHVSKASCLFRMLAFIEMTDLLNLMKDRVQWRKFIVASDHGRRKYK